MVLGKKKLWGTSTCLGHLTKHLIHMSIIDIEIINIEIGGWILCNCACMNIQFVGTTFKKCTSVIQYFLVRILFA